MKILRYAMFATMIMISSLTAYGQIGEGGPTHFRGIEKVQTRPDGSDNYYRPSGGVVLERINWHIDLQDDFTRTSTSTLDHSEVDGWQVGFVPPVKQYDLPEPYGELPEPYATQHGTWMGGSDYEVSNESVHRTNFSRENALTCLPWEVTPELGDDYLLAIDASIAPGETVRLAYFGDVAANGRFQGLMESANGQLVLQVTRTSSSAANWTVKWDGTAPGMISGKANGLDFSEDLNIMLGWDDGKNANDDRFDAWIGNERVAGVFGMGGQIESQGIGFELTGANSFVTSFTAAVPEPGTCLLTIIGMVSLCGFRFRRTA